MPRPLARSAIRLTALLGLWAMASCAWAAESTVTETIVMVRHGEKPALGLGQLDCQGLNRALALPAVIARQFGKPDAIFAPDPAQTKDDHGQPYDYVRPLATIEPTAIAYGMPIDASIGVADLDALKQKLTAPGYRGALLLVAWEHSDIVKLARALIGDHGGEPATVPEWKGHDFDSIYIVKISHSGAKVTATFEQGHEGLDGQATNCPGL